MNKSSIRIGSNRSFGIVFFILFLVIALYPIIGDQEIRIWSLLTSLIFLILGLMNSKFLTPLNKLWYRFGILLGNIISPIVMGIVFFMIITPTSIILKIFSKDILNLKKNNSKSYWINVQNKDSKMKDQF
ncbi:hypothetical protein IDG58_02450 [Pelagibacterales bacterium SAG-MED19]|nr:hypothetical protein [Pelagibacterales bacterium SAG-MED19]